MLCLLLQHTSTHALAAQSVTPAQWHQLTTDKAFTYKNDTETIQPPIEYKATPFDKAITAFFKFWGSKEGNIILWILIICIVGYIVYRLFFRNDSFLFGKNKKLMGDGNASTDDEKDLTSTNWETLLHNAVHNDDYRLAVRYSYMWMLQIMQQRGLIQYRIDKTNYEYYTELNETNYKQPFKQLSREYEYAWYGRIALSHSAYSDFKNLFDNVRHNLQA